jgi:type III restriction enzyme
MTHLFQALAERVDVWRQQAYPCPAYPAVREVLEYATLDDGSGQFRYLRKAQYRALETYWYLRLVLDTPTVPQLYKKLFETTRERREAMGLVASEIVTLIADTDFDSVLGRVRNDNAFVRKHGLESLRETLAMDYPSYILALAMGAGKTILMGAIVATEFALALEYPDTAPSCRTR